jgi:hypothetical protein
VPNFEFHDSFIYPDQPREQIASKNTISKRAPTPGPSEFVIGLAGSRKGTAGTYPLCEHEKEVSNEEESNPTSANLLLFTFRLAFVNC